MPEPAATPAIRPYTPADEESWLRCRVLSFLHTPYYDDVQQRRAEIPLPGFGLVAEEGGRVVGIMDIAVDGGLATVDTLAVHPDRQGCGIGTALLAAARERVHALGADVLDAWTRDHPATLRWYRSRGFAESEHYLHVYADARADPAEPDRAVAGRRDGLRPLTLFLQARIADEPWIRREFARVHVCRRFTLPVR